MELLYFTATWCQPCKVFGPVMETVVEDVQVPIKKMDIANYPAEVDKYGIMSVPTVVLVNGGNEVDRFTGARTKEMVLSWIEGAYEQNTGRDS